MREVDARLTALGAVSGTGSQAERARLVRELMGAATEDEQRFLLGLLTGEVRQGALDAVAVEGLAGATGAPAADVRRAVMLAGSLQTVARGPARRGPGGAVRVPAHGRPAGAPDAGAQRRVGVRGGRQTRRLRGRGEARRHPGAGAPRRRRRCAIYTRTLDDITDRLPELTAAARELPGERFILDGEVIALDGRGRPRSFQETAGRVGSRVDVAAAARTVPVSPVFFDALSVDGRDLLDLPFAERHAALARLVPEPMRVRRALVAGPEEAAGAERFLADTLARGHEGVVVKALDAAYARDGAAPPG